MPVTINGRVEKPGDVDYFSFKAQAGQKLVMEVFARRLESPLDSILTLYDADGRSWPKMTMRKTSYRLTSRTMPIPAWSTRSSRRENTC